MEPIVVGIKTQLVNFLVDEGYLEGFWLIPKDISKKDHGSCCYCQDCGHGNDECVCDHNFLLENINRIFGE